MTWKTEYPTLAAVKAASPETLFAWHENLPCPQTDVERTVHRRISKMCHDIASSECREKAPEVADKWNELCDMLDGLGMQGTKRM